MAKFGFKSICLTLQLQIIVNQTYLADSLSHYLFCLFVGFN